MIKRLTTILTMVMVLALPINAQALDMNYNTDTGVVTITEGNMKVILAEGNTRFGVIMKDKFSGAGYSAIEELETPFKIVDGQPVIPQNILVMLDAKVVEGKDKNVKLESTMDKEKRKAIYPTFEAKMDIEKVSEHFVVTVKETEYNSEDFAETLRSVNVEPVPFMHIMEHFEKGIKDGEVFEFNTIYSYNGAGQQSLMIEKSNGYLVITLAEKVEYDINLMEYKFN